LELDPSLDPSGFAEEKFYPHKSGTSGFELGTSGFTLDPWVRTEIHLVYPNKYPKNPTMLGVSRPP